MSLEPKPRSDWEMYDQMILEAIKQIEYENPFVPVSVSQIHRRLKDKATRRSIYNHLYGLLDARRIGLLQRKLVIKVGRGFYSSKMAMIAKRLAQEFVVREFSETVPRLEDENFSEFLSRHLSISTELEQEHRRKRKIPLIGLLYDRKLKNVLENKRLMEPIIQKWLRNDLDFIEKATEINLLFSKKLPYLNTKRIREAFAEVLYYVLGHERRLAESKGEKFSLGDFGLNIVVSFNPKKAGEPPSRPTFKELITEIEKMPPKYAQSLGFDEERIKHLKLQAQKENEVLLIMPEQ